MKPEERKLALLQHIEALLKEHGLGAAFAAPDTIDITTESDPEGQAVVIDGAGDGHLYVVTVEVE